MNGHGDTTFNPEQRELEQTVREALAPKLRELTEDEVFSIAKAWDRRIGEYTTEYQVTWTWNEIRKLLVGETK